MQTRGSTFSSIGSVTRLGEWSIGDSRPRESARYLCPEEVFEQNHDRLVQALTIVTGNREMAADAVQEAFVRLVRGWDRLSTYEDPAGWVRRVALNLARDYRRSLWRQGRLLLKMEQHSLVPRGASPSDERLWEHLAALPVKQRTALALYYLDNLTTREVADAMHVSEGTVKQHLHRARETLKAAYKDVRDA